MLPWVLEIILCAYLHSKSNCCVNRNNENSTSQTSRRWTSSWGHEDTGPFALLLSNYLPGTWGITGSLLCSQPAHCPGQQDTQQHPSDPTCDLPVFSVEPTRKCTGRKGTYLFPFAATWMTRPQKSNPYPNSQAFSIEQAILPLVWNHRRP